LSITALVSSFDYVLNELHSTKKADVAEYPCGSGHVGLFTNESPDRNGLPFI